MKSKIGDLITAIVKLDRPDISRVELEDLIRTTTGVLGSNAISDYRKALKSRGVIRVKNSYWENDYFINREIE